MKTNCIILIDGTDVSAKIGPVLINLEVTETSGKSSDTCGIELDDTNGQLQFPQDGVAIEVQLGDETGVATVFKGTVDDVRSGGARSGGMRMMISARGMDTKSKVKQRNERHWDNKTVKDVISDAAKDAGLSGVIVDPTLGAISLPYFAMQHESLIGFGQRLADEIGGSFKIVGKTAIIANENGGTSASGQQLATFAAKRGVNLISWEISPSIGRHRHGAVETRWFDPKTGKWNVEREETGDTEAPSTHKSRRQKKDKAHAKIHVAGHVKHAKRERGGGSIAVNGTLEPQPEALVALVGARPGVDGNYRINTVFHTYSRSAGWTTRLDIRQPDAPPDDRQPTASTATTPPSQVVAHFGHA